jgi:hypothetical protein
MLLSFISMTGLMIALMVHGKSRGKMPKVFVAVLIAALIQTAITLYDFFTMGIPTP